MAFTNVDFDGAGTGMGKAPKRASYRTTDTFATILGAGYFNDIADALQTGDTLYVAASDGFSEFKVDVAAGVVTLALEVKFGALT